MFQNSREFASSFDKADKLARFRSYFHIPKTEKGEESIYLCGNSLGCMPKAARAAVELEFSDWEKLGVEGHFLGTNPWMPYHKRFREKENIVVGALPGEVVVMNNLTTNLHLMMVSFYRPTAQKFKIIVESGAFPSDQYAIESQVKFHGYKPEEAIIELKPRDGEHLLRTEDIIRTLQKNAGQVALVMMGGVNYYTGQFYELPKITLAAHTFGALVGFDLAHAAGNVPLQLHNWEVDFAVWCTYKYLNSGPGGTSGVFVHENHANNPSLPRFAGWWGHDEEERFLMKKGFKPMIGAEGWQLSNAQIFPMAIHMSALDIFLEAGMDALREKSLLLTGFLDYLIGEIISNKPDCGLEMISPVNPNERGCQISILAKKNGKTLFQHLSEAGIIADWREPNVIRVAPVPLYNTFNDVYTFAHILDKNL